MFSHRMKIRVEIIAESKEGTKTLADMREEHERGQHLENKRVGRMQERGR